MAEPMNAFGYQVGGDHYKQFVTEPIKVIDRIASEKNYCVATAFKYLIRYPYKDGQQDLEKASHYLHLATEFPMRYVDSEEWFLDVTNFACVNGLNRDHASLLITVATLIKNHGIDVAKDFLAQFIEPEKEEHKDDKSVA